MLSTRAAAYCSWCSAVTSQRMTSALPPLRDRFRVSSSVGLRASAQHCGGAELRQSLTGDRRANAAARSGYEGDLPDRGCAVSI